MPMSGSTSDHRPTLDALCRQCISLVISGLHTRQGLDRLRFALNGWGAAVAITADQTRLGSSQQSVREILCGKVVESADFLAESFVLPRDPLPHDHGAITQFEHYARSEWVHLCNIEGKTVNSDSLCYTRLLIDHTPFTVNLRRPAVLIRTPQQTIHAFQLIVAFDEHCLCPLSATFFDNRVTELRRLVEHSHPPPRLLRERHHVLLQMCLYFLAISGENGFVNGNLGSTVTDWEKYFDDAVLCQGGLTARHHEGENHDFLEHHQHSFLGWCREAVHYWTSTASEIELLGEACGRMYAGVYALFGIALEQHSHSLAAHRTAARCSSSPCSPFLAIARRDL